MDQNISSASNAGLVIALAVNDPAPGKRGTSRFVIPTARAGHVVEKVEHTMGHAAPDTCAIRFENVLVEDELVPDTEGGCCRIAVSNPKVQRIGIAARAVSMAQAALGSAIDYAK